MRHVLFHQPGHPDLPWHGARYYWLLALLLSVTGMVYLVWTGLSLV